MSVGGVHWHGKCRKIYQIHNRDKIEEKIILVGDWKRIADKHIAGIPLKFNKNILHKSTEVLKKFTTITKSSRLCGVTHNFIQTKSWA